jgi:hypothetical protein
MKIKEGRVRGNDVINKLVCTESKIMFMGRTEGHNKTQQQERKHFDKH